MRRRSKFVIGAIALAGATLIALAGAGAVRAQTSSPGGTAMLRLYVDPATGQVFTRPGKGRSLLTTIPATALDPNAIEQHVEEKTRTQLQQNQQQLLDLEKKNDELAANNHQLAQQVADIKPAWRDYIMNFQNKFSIGTLVYGDYRFYSHTGFQPQELTQINAPGPGNNGFNSFDISRAYLNFFFYPAEGMTLRITPNIYRTNGTAPADKVGSSSAISSNLSGDMGFRLKYAYLQYNKIFDRISDSLKGDGVKGGFIPNPLVAWEEDLFGYRYVTLTPWNYLSLSSTQPGVSIAGPIKFNEKQYADYDFGAYNNSTFHAFEQANTKQVMGRLSVYPFGAKWRFQGLGATFFYDYGYGNVAPDVSPPGTTTTSLLHGKQGHIMRAAALLHYTAENWGLIAEYDFGHNAFTGGNLFSSSGPQDYFGVGKTSFAGFSSMTTAFLENGSAVERGLDFMGHYHIPATPFTLFGLFQWFQPNTKVNNDPLDFQRWVAGVSYQYNEYLRFAIDSQNTMFYHSQNSVPESYVNSFAPVFAAPAAGKFVTDAVPRDTHAFFINMEVNY
ncbi:MAG: hypothetical protein ACREQR_12585 [Candidatus Binataceae bacterium]